jgi:hypothetical protein
VWLAPRLWARRRWRVGLRRRVSCRRRIRSGAGTLPAGGSAVRPRSASQGCQVHSVARFMVLPTSSFSAARCLPRSYEPSAGMTTLGGAWTTAGQRDPPPRSPQEVCRTLNVVDDTLHRRADSSPMSATGRGATRKPSEAARGPLAGRSALRYCLAPGPAGGRHRVALGADGENQRPTRRGCAGTRQRCCVRGWIDVRSLHIVVTRT